MHVIHEVMDGICVALSKVLSRSVPYPRQAKPPLDRSLPVPRTGCGVLYQRFSSGKQCMTISNTGYGASCFFVWLYTSHDGCPGLLFHFTFRLHVQYLITCYKSPWFPGSRSCILSSLSAPSTWLLQHQAPQYAWIAVTRTPPSQTPLSPIPLLPPMEVQDNALKK